jgi:hypothetical protein
MKRMVWLVIALAAIGCGAGAPKSYSLNGTWTLSGAVNGEVVTITQTGDSVIGPLQFEGQVVGSLFGTNANGNVILAVGNYNGLVATGYLTATSSFRGHFTNSSTVVGTLSTGYALTLTKQ